jgi:hypothetical protein
MTPHCHWIHNYGSYHVRVELAVLSILLGLGPWSLIDPVIGRKSVHSVELTHVSYVSQLRSNLLSCLYLTWCCGLEFHVDSSFMHFMRNSVTLFQAQVTPNNAAYTNGTALPASEAACAITTCPFNLQLWYEPLFHHNLADIQKLISNRLAP